MEFGLSSEQILLQDTINRFLTEVVPLDEVRKVATGETSDAGIWQGLAELGIPGLLIPEEHGGVGLGMLDAVVVAEALGYHVTPAPFLSSAVIAPLVFIASGQKESLLPLMAQGEYRVGIGFGEAVGARTGAGLKAVGGKLTGRSLYVLDATADGYLVTTANKQIYFVEADAAGMSRQLLKTIDRTRTTCELVFDQTPAELITSNGAVFDQAIDAGRIVQAADTLGASQCALDQAVAYAKERKQFNRVIGSFQAVKHMCAEMVANLEPCRSLVWYAGHAYDNVPEEATLLACQTKSHLSEVGKFVVKTATEVHGGMGFTDLVGLHYWFKRVGVNRQLLGSPELVRELAAKAQGLV